MKTAIKGYLKDYFYGKIDKSLCLHKICIAVEYSDPNWSYDDLVAGRKENNILGE